MVPGRAAIPRLQGPKGSLHILALYFPTGTEIQEDDRRELTPNLLDPSFKALRAAMRRKVANALAPEVILVVEGGRIAARGDLRTLLKDSPLFHEIWTETLKAHAHGEEAVALPT